VRVPLLSRSYVIVNLDTRLDVAGAVDDGLDLPGSGGEPAKGAAGQEESRSEEGKSECLHVKEELGSPTQGTPYSRLSQFPLVVIEVMIQSSGGGVKTPLFP